MRRVSNSSLLWGLRLCKNCSFRKYLVPVFDSGTWGPGTLGGCKRGVFFGKQAFFFLGFLILSICEITESQTGGAKSVSSSPYQLVLIHHQPSSGRAAPRPLRQAAKSLAQATWEGPRCDSEAGSRKAGCVLCWCAGLRGLSVGREDVREGLHRTLVVSWERVGHLSAPVSSLGGLVSDTGRRILS